MHDMSYSEMATNIKRHLRHLPEGSRVVDFGSFDVNGTYRPLIEPQWEYLGVDIELGPNVDHVMTSEFDSGLPEGAADVVISGQCIEHCRNPFRVMEEIVRIAKPGALLLIVAPCAGWDEHRYPIDCWRFLPDGMRELIEQAGADCVVPPYVTGGPLTDCWGVGRKK